MKYPKEHLIELSKLRPNINWGSGLDAAYSFCAKIAKSHYENFPVGSLLVNKSDRPHFYSVYAFARLADDIGDEYDFSTEERLDLLSELEDNLKKVIDGEKTDNPILIAVAYTLELKGIQTDVLTRLIRAFEADANFKSPKSYSEIYDYCTYSANPVGELVLYISSEFSEEARLYSDKICTALQMINFWQDLSRDIPNGRLYIPEEAYKPYGLAESDFLEKLSGIKPSVLEKLVEDINRSTEELLYGGSEITKYIKSRRLRAELAAIFYSAEIMISKNKSAGAELFFKRPKLKKSIFLKNLPKVSLFLLGLKKGLVRPLH